MTTTKATTNPPAPASTSQAETYQRLRAHLAFLKLGAAAEALPTILDTARDQQLPVLDTLEQLLGIEAAAAEHRKLTTRTQFAALPAPWSLADYDYSAQPGIDEKLIHELTTLRFLDDATNVIFIGPPGVGKTMLAIGLARATVQAGHKAYFTTCEDLIRRLNKATAEHRFNTGLRFFTQPRLLVIDEFGYRRLDETGQSMLFEVINTRYLKSSTIITSHVGISGWADRLGDPMLAAALVDRLLHRGILIGIDGPSYRMRTHQARAEALRTTTSNSNSKETNTP